MRTKIIALIIFSFSMYSVISAGLSPSDNYEGFGPPFQDVADIGEVASYQTFDGTASYGNSLYIDNVIFCYLAGTGICTYMHLDKVTKYVLDVSALSSACDIRIRLVSEYGTDWGTVSSHISSTGSHTITCDPPLEICEWGWLDAQFYIYVDVLTAGASITLSATAYGTVLPYPSNPTLKSVPTIEGAFGNTYEYYAISNETLSYTFNVSCSIYDSDYNQAIQDILTYGKTYDEIPADPWYWVKIYWGDGGISDFEEDEVYKWMGYYDNCKRFWLPYEFEDDWQSQGRVGYLKDEDQTLTYSYHAPGEYLVEWQTKYFGHYHPWTNYTSHTMYVIDHPPSEPVITAPQFPLPDEVCSLIFESSDGDNDDLTYEIEWGDGNTTTTASYPSDFPVASSHTYAEKGKYIVNITAEDDTPTTINGSPVPELDSGYVSFTLEVGENDEPNVPSTPVGPTEVVVGQNCCYETKAKDPDGDNVRVWFKWGDGETDKSGFKKSGSNFNLCHTWTTAGTYTIVCKSEDEYHNMSRWQYESEGLVVNVYEPTPPPPDEGLPLLWISLIIILIIVAIILGYFLLKKKK